MKTPKSKQPTRDSKNYLKKQYKYFWDSPFAKNDFSVEQIFQMFTRKKRVFDTSFNANFYTFFIKVPIKLWLENKLTLKEKNNILSMLKSPDEETIFLAISILKQKSKKL